LVTFSADHTAALWSEDGQLERRYQGHESYVWGVVPGGGGAFTTWSADGTLRSWSVADDRVLRIFAGHERAVKGAFGMACGDVLSWSADGTLRRWSMERTEAASVYEGREQPVTGAVVIGGRLFGWTDKNRVGVWSLEGGTRVGVWSAEELRRECPDAYWVWLQHRHGVGPVRGWLPAWCEPGFVRRADGHIDLRPWHETGEWCFGAVGETGSALWMSGETVAVIGLGGALD